MRIVSYNIRKSVGLDWKRDPDRIVNVLAELDADIVILQEADRRFGARYGTLPAGKLEDSLGYRFADVAVRPYSHGWHGNAILYRKTVSLIIAERIELPCFEPRGAVAATFKVSDKQQLRVIGAHLSLLKATRHKQCHAIKEFIDKPQPDFPSLIGGDFNERSASGTISKAFGSSFKVVSPGPSFHTSRPVWHFDRFVHNGTLSTLNCGVHSSENSRQASDHLPIYIDVGF